MTDKKAETALDEAKKVIAELSKDSRHIVIACNVGDLRSEIPLKNHAVAVNKLSVAEFKAVMCAILDSAFGDELPNVLLEMVRDVAVMNYLEKKAK